MSNLLSMSQSPVSSFSLSRRSVSCSHAVVKLVISYSNNTHGAQLDDRYYKGLEGQYTYELHFLLRESGSDDHIALAGTESGSRSVSTEVELEPGKYELIPKIVAYRNKYRSPVEEAVKKAAESNLWKLQQVGLNHDRAHLKACQWKPKPEPAKDEMSIPIRDSKAPEQLTTVEVVVKQESSTVPTTDRSTAAENTGAATDRSDTTKEGNSKREHPPGSLAVASGATGQESQQPDVTAGPEGEGEEDPDPVEQKPKAEEEEDEEKPAASPWNAVCVIGLRVYSKDANLGLRLDES